MTTGGNNFSITLIPFHYDYFLSDAACIKAPSIYFINSSALRKCFSLFSSAHVTSPCHVASLLPSILITKVSASFAILALTIVLSRPLGIVTSCINGSPC